MTLKCLYRVDGELRSFHVQCVSCPNIGPMHVSVSAQYLDLRSGHRKCFVEVEDVRKFGISCRDANSPSHLNIHTALTVMLQSRVCDAAEHIRDGRVAPHS